MLVSLTVGKVDAGVAVLLTQDNRLVSSPAPGSLRPLKNNENLWPGREQPQLQWQSSLTFFSD